MGVRESARFNAVMVAIKLAAVLFFIAAGATYVEPENWSPFMPFGFSGVMAAAAVVFFAYIGFDAVSTTAEEAKNPQRDLPIGIIASFVLCTILYLVVSAVLTGILPVVESRPTRSSSMRRSVCAGGHRQDWAAGLVSAGAVAGITSVLLVMLMSQPRIFFAMSRDRLLPAGASRSTRIQDAVHHHIITAWWSRFAPALVPIQILGDMTSIGSLSAFCRLRRGDDARSASRGRPALPGAGRLRRYRSWGSSRPLSDAQPAGHHLDRFLGWLDIAFSSTGATANSQPPAGRRRSRQTHGA